MKKIDWEEIEDIAETIFNIWSDNPELQWAEQAWQILDEQKLTGYESPLEKLQVIVNFLTLGHIYHIFCNTAFDESTYFKDCIIYCMPQLQECDVYISSLSLGILLKIDLETYEKKLSNLDEEELIPHLLIEATEKNFDNLFKALLSGFGSRNELMISLWNSNVNEDGYKISHINELGFFEAGEAYNFISTYC